MTAYSDLIGVNGGEDWEPPSGELALVDLRHARDVPADLGWAEENGSSSMDNLKESINKLEGRYSNC